MTLDRSRYTIAGGRPPARRDARVPRTGTENPSFRPHRKPSRRSTSLGYGVRYAGSGTPRAGAYAPGTRHPPTPNARGLSRNGQHAGHDALYGPPSALVGFFTPSDSSHDRALLYLYCISPGPPPPVGPPGASGPRCGPARTCTPALGRSSPRLLAYTVTTVAGTARAIHATGFHTHIPLSPPPDF